MTAVLLVQETAGVDKVVAFFARSSLSFRRYPRDVAWPEHPSILGTILGSQNRRDHRLSQQSLSQLSKRRGE
jgi:hypothetical protein